MVRKRLGTLELARRIAAVNNSTLTEKICSHAWETFRKYRLHP